MGRGDKEHQTVCLVLVLWQLLWQMLSVCELTVQVSCDNYGALTSSHVQITSLLFSVPRNLNGPERSKAAGEKLTCPACGLRTALSVIIVAL